MTGGGKYDNSLNFSTGVGNEKEQKKVKKPQNAAILAIKRMQDAKRAQEEEEKKIEEEERRKEEEEILLAALKKEQEEIERKCKRDKRKAKQEELKKLGTKSERERLKRDREQIQLLQKQKEFQSVPMEHLLGNQDKNIQAEDFTKKKPIYTTMKKKQPSKEFISPKVNEELEKKPTQSNSIQNQRNQISLKIDVEPEVLDSWEDGLLEHDSNTDLSLSDEDKKSLIFSSDENILFDKKDISLSNSIDYLKNLSLSGDIPSSSNLFKDEVDFACHQNSIPSVVDIILSDSSLKNVSVKPTKYKDNHNTPFLTTTLSAISSSTIQLPTNGTLTNFQIDPKNVVVTSKKKMDDFRSPIICVLGHVDTGKTKLLDKLRETNIQEGEAGGITQQIGATFFPREAIEMKMNGLNVSASCNVPNSSISEVKSSSCSISSRQEFYSQTTTLIKGDINISGSIPQLKSSLKGVSGGDISDVKIPGLVVIDTPGHASFANLRSRGSSLCHMAILVVDILHGLEPQTLESIQLLRSRRTPFIVALNKIDRIYSWRSIPGRPWAEVISAQSNSPQGKNSPAMVEFYDRLEKIKVAFATQASLNAELFTINEDQRGTVSLIPISALTGEGIPDLLRVVIDLTQRRLTSQLIKNPKEPFAGTILEVKNVEGLGHVVDAIITHGSISEGDRIVIGGFSGPICTQVRSLLTPEPMRETRVKMLRFITHPTVEACMGVRIVAPELEKALSGSRIIRVMNDIDISVAFKEVNDEMNDIMTNFIDRSSMGVTVQASTLGSLEALLSFLTDSKIPVAAASIGTIYKRDVLSASVILEQHADKLEVRDYAVILAFDVKVDKEAHELADELGIKIFTADIIYHLLDAFMAHHVAMVEARKKEMAPQAVFPCVLKIVPGCVFNKRSPIILGVNVLEGTLRIGTPIAATVDLNPSVKDITKSKSTNAKNEWSNRMEDYHPDNHTIDHSEEIFSEGSRTYTILGKVTSIELNHKSIDVIRRGGPSVAIKIEAFSSDAPRMFGRHFIEKDSLISVISRSSIDILKNTFRNEMTPEDWVLVKKLKPLFGIP